MWPLIETIQNSLSIQPNIKIIRNDEWYNVYSAIDTNRSDTEYVGVGDTKQSALNDLCDKLIDNQVYPKDVIINACRDMSIVIDHESKDDLGIQDEQPRID